MLQKLLSLVVNVVVPLLVAWLQKLVPPAALAHLKGAEVSKEEYRAQMRQWVTDMLTEFGQKLVAKGLVPVWLQLEIPVIEQLVADAIDSALDGAGL